VILSDPSTLFPLLIVVPTMIPSTTAAATVGDDVSSSSDNPSTDSDPTPIGRIVTLNLSPVRPAVAAAAVVSIPTLHHHEQQQQQHQYQAGPAPTATAASPVTSTSTTNTTNYVPMQQQMSQQHGHGGSIFPPYSHPYVVGSTSTTAFPQQPPPQRRSGKWTVEEEEYANLLIELFNRGSVFEEIQNGVTLRSFLSRKLFCAPMRISKKFAGKGIGKKVYIKNPNAMINFFALQCPTTTTTTTSTTNRSSSMMVISRLKEAEMKFLRVAFPGMHGSMACFL
jgi:hypothetical protein